MVEYSEKKMRTITLEEHYATPAFMEGPGRGLKAQAQLMKENKLPIPMDFMRIIDRLVDLNEGRIVDMDEAGIDVQVLSLTAPGAEQLNEEAAIDIAQDANDYLADAVERYPNRFVGFTALPTVAPDVAASELERMVREHDFKGGIINGHIGGRYLDNEYFWPILERAETLKVPLYLHPTIPPEPVVKAYYTGNFPREVTGSLMMAGWGWHIETAVHILRLILSGVFDHYPELQFIIGHMGETLPFMMQRIDRGLPMGITKLEHPISYYLNKNIYYTFSGLNYTQTFLDLYLHVGAERIMFSADYPYSSMTDAYKFLNQLPISTSDKERIAHSNAEKLLRM